MTYGAITFDKVMFHIYGVELADGIIKFHTVARGPDKDHVREWPTTGAIKYQVYGSDGHRIMEGFQPARIFDEAREALDHLADIWMTFPVHILSVENPL